MFCGGNDVALLRGGDALFPAMRAAIDVARESVWLATYIFEQDDEARAMLRSLAAAAARGVQVRVVVDGFGSQGALAAVQEALLSAGAEPAVYRPVAWWSWARRGHMRRLHQKLCVVDGAVGFVGGINVIGDRYDQHHGRLEAPRLDYAVRVVGPVVRPIEHTVRAVWSRAHFGRDWRDEIAGVARARRPLKELRARLRSLRMPQSRDFLLPGGASDSPEAPAALHAAFVVRDNLRQRRTIERTYLDAIRHARRRVDIVSPYFYPAGPFRRALRHAARRGVRVRLLMQGRWDYRAAALAARALYAELIGRGVEIYEYTPAFLHAKVAVVDDDWATVGSSNIDPLSLLLNLEANVVVRDAAFARCLGDEIDAAIGASRRIDPREAAGWFGALHRGFVAACARLYLRIAGATGRY